MCKLLRVSRSLVYYHLNNRESNSSNKDSEIEKYIIKIFHRSKNNYGTRKIKVELEKLGHQVSRRRIARIMKANALVSNYTVAQYKIHSKGCNESKTSNIVGRQFDDRDKLEVAVSDLTYVRAGSKWNSVCTFKILEAEFIYQSKFESLEVPKLELAEYIYWYNHIRIHGSLGYVSPIEYRNRASFRLVA